MEGREAVVLKGKAWGLLLGPNFRLQKNWYNEVSMRIV
jgi:hypothetical protein